MEAFRVSVRRPIEFLTSVLEAFSGDEDAKVSFEGDLRLLHEAGLVGTTIDETANLRRQTIQPIDDFVVVPLSPHNLGVLVSLCGRVGVRTRVHHVQIEAAGVLVFAAHDNFDPCGVWISTRFTEANLLRLQLQHVIAWYELVAGVEQDGHTAGEAVE